PDESDYLRAAANRYFKRQIAPADITATWSGIRALYDDGRDEARTITRDYVLELDTSGAAVLSVFGGKITTARALAEHAMKKLAPVLEFTARPVTRDRPLP
ncbi:MAG TPA: glycerol-3-phosphate dehydrogenase, partial [Sphingomonas sp.]|nr:glycerol-3-phosphate dehydrogenase [Sphingomonas sp.]